VKERKPPASERFYSFQAVGRGAARLKRGRISRSTERDLRLCLKNSRTFEKVRSKLPAAVIFYLMENFRLRKFTFILPQANHHSAQADYHSREA